MSKQPFLPLFFGDFLASTAEWSGEEASLYLTLLGHQWSLGSLPADRVKLARLVRWDRKLFDRCWATVSAKFSDRDGRLYNERLESHRDHANEISKRRADAGAKGAANRWQKDGNCHELANGLAIDLSKHPIQTIPNHINPPEKKNTPARRASALDPEFGMTPERREYAEKHLPNVDTAELLAAFKDRHAAKGTVAKDWEATWRTWVRNALKFGYPMLRPQEQARLAQIRFDANGRQISG